MSDQTDQRTGSKGLVPDEVTIVRVDQPGGAYVGDAGRGQEQY